MIALQDISKTYGRNEIGITPVRGVDLRINRGEFVLLFGRSGSGKTTLLNLAAGLARPTSGKVFVKGTDVWGLSDKQVAAVRTATGFIFQFPSLIPSLNALENTVLPAMFGTKWTGTAAKERGIALLQKLGLSKKTDSLPGQLSAGEQKRVVMARALINEPEILFADEPTADLDEQTENDIITILKELHSGGMTIFMVTHNTGLVPIANRSLKIENGSVIDLKVPAA
jgi:ABC-type lipoprotein export system ATPase subunit